MESVTLTTADGVKIAANYYPAEGDRYAILLHMMPATKESWQGFAEALAVRGVASVAIDERGHGASSWGPDTYKTFRDEEQQGKILDVRAAWAFLEKMGAAPEKTAVVGASIGANLAIQHLSEHSSIRAAVALSPGLDYHSVVTEGFVQDLAAHQQLLLVASKEDAYAFTSARKLHQLNGSQTELIEREGIGHGTQMFSHDGQLMQEVLMWIDDRL